MVYVSPILDTKFGLTYYFITHVEREIVGYLEFLEREIWTYPQYKYIINGFEVYVYDITVTFDYFFTHVLLVIAIRWFDFQSF